MQIKKIKNENGILIPDLTNNKYGLLTVINYSHNHIRYGSYWNCLCDCGNYKIINASDLKKSNGTKSCGCLRKQGALTTAKKNRDRINESVLNKRFGKLYVQEFDYIRKEYKCVCDCGNITFSDSAHLKNGHKSSCGCLCSSFFERSKNFISGTFFGGKKKYIYGLRRLCADRIVYVGQSTDSELRLLQHIKQAVSRTHTNKKLEKWILETINLNSMIAIEILEETNERFANDVEYNWIVYFNENYRYNLFNIADPRNPRRKLINGK